ncbi:MAG: CoA pyrophosphatase [Pseudohongiellaceae bacterium]
MNKFHSHTDDPVLNRLRTYFSRSGAKIPAGIPHSDPEINARTLARRHELREAAVLIPVVKPSHLSPSQIILTVRSSNLSSHAGQISLPGGSRAPQDADIITTALRESAEEIGIRMEDVEVLGSLGEIMLPSGFRVTPVIGLLPSDLQLTPCPIEVNEIFLAPSSLLLDPTAYKISSWNYENRQLRIFELNYQHYRIWGATAAILQHLASEIA